MVKNFTSWLAAAIYAAGLVSVELIGCGAAESDSADIGQSPEAIAAPNTTIKTASLTRTWGVTLAKGNPACLSRDTAQNCYYLESLNNQGIRNISVCDPTGLSVFFTNSLNQNNFNKFAATNSCSQPHNITVQDALFQSRPAGSRKISDLMQVAFSNCTETYRPTGTTLKTHWFACLSAAVQLDESQMPSQANEQEAIGKGILAAIGIGETAYTRSWAYVNFDGGTRPTIFNAQEKCQVDVLPGGAIVNNTIQVVGDCQGSD